MKRIPYTNNTLFLSDDNNTIVSIDNVELYSLIQDDIMEYFEFKCVKGIIFNKI